MEMARKIYTTKELAKRFECTSRTITDWINDGCPSGNNRNQAIDTAAYAA
tara:strand:- start:6 stop:155 length:150 start_codon:yes stop_codon:yes gene_type:complete